MTEPPHHETISLPRDLTMRTHDFGVDSRLEIQPGRQGKVFNGDMADCLAKNFAQARKRYRKTSGDTIDLGQFDKSQQDQQLMQKVHVTRVACDELSQPAKPETESCIPQDG